MVRTGETSALWKGTSSRCSDEAWVQKVSNLLPFPSHFQSWFTLLLQRGTSNDRRPSASSRERSRFLELRRKANVGMRSRRRRFLANPATHEGNPIECRCQSALRTAERDREVTDSSRSSHFARMGEMLCGATLSDSQKAGCTQFQVDEGRVAFWNQVSKRPAVRTGSLSLP